MVDYYALLNEVLRQRPDLKREDLETMVEDKTRKVGSGYLTKPGAIFLVAAELNVYLEKSRSSNLTLNDLYIGANEITVVGRIFSIYPYKKFVRRDGTEGKYLSLIHI